MRFAARTASVAAADYALFRYRQAQVSQDAVRLLFVAGKFHRDIAGPGRRRGLNALLVAAMPELHEAVAIEPKPRDVPFPRQRLQAMRYSDPAPGPVRSV